MTHWVAIAAMFLLSASVNTERAMPLPEDLIGTWAGESPGATAGEVIYIESQYAANGRFNGALEIRSAPVSGDEPVCIEFSGRWTVEGDIITYSDINYSNGLYVPNIEDRIVNISTTTVNYIAVYDGSAFQRHRIPRMSLRCDDSRLEAEPNTSTQEDTNQ